jgi:hypothetical protein
MRLLPAVAARLGWLGRRGCKAWVCRVVHLDKGVCVCGAGVAPVPGKASVPDSSNSCSTQHDSLMSPAAAACVHCASHAQVQYGKLVSLLLL